MLARCLAAAALAATVGCAGADLRRVLDLGVEHRVDVPVGQSSVEARVGDVVYLEVGPGVLDPARDGFRATINGRQATRAGWDTQYATLAYKFRPEVIGRHHVEVYAKYPGEDPKTLAWDITVNE